MWLFQRGEDILCPMHGAVPGFNTPAADACAETLVHFDTKLLTLSEREESIASKTSKSSYSGILRTELLVVTLVDSMQLKTQHREGLSPLPVCPRVTSCRTHRQLPPPLVSSALLHGLQPGQGAGHALFLSCACSGTGSLVSVHGVSVPCALPVAPSQPSPCPWQLIPEAGTSNLVMVKRKSSPVRATCRQGFNWSSAQGAALME